MLALLFAIMVSSAVMAQSAEDFYNKGIEFCRINNYTEAIEWFRKAAEQGSDFGELFACVAPVLFDKAQKPDIGGMMKIAEKNPWAYALVADQYTGIDCKSIRDDKLATYYFQKADEFGFLSQRGARWLMNYYMKNNVQIDEVEMQRLQKLSNRQEWEKLFEDDDFADDDSLELEEPCIIEEVDTLEYD